MAKSLTAFFLFFSGYASGQHFPDPNLQSLIDAERSFSRMAKDENTRDAFLHFLADDAVTASPGKGPRKGKNILRNNQPVIAGYIGSRSILILPPQVILVLPWGPGNSDKQKRMLNL